ncbi:uncharacterized protein LOC144364052 [Saccoglossus kowalevskii]
MAAKIVTIVLLVFVCCCIWFVYIDLKSLQTVKACVLGSTDMKRKGVTKIEKQYSNKNRKRPLESNTRGHNNSAQKEKNGSTTSIINNTYTINHTKSPQSCKPQANFIFVKTGKTGGILEEV